MTILKSWFVISLLLLNETFVLNYGIQEPETWTGRWFPEEPSSTESQTVRVHTTRLPMGVSNSKCDDAKSNLTLDWSGSFESYSCLNPRARFIPNKLVDSIVEFENIPKAYVAPHFCMNKEIKYSNTLPSYGPHRPLWPKYGEYKFLPKQRWLHSLEHGGIVALYHPCADLRQISLLKKLVKSCLRRHVISPSNDLSKERPLALLAWGVRYTMSVIYPDAVKQFIQKRALKGPEKLADDGQFDAYLVEPAKIVSDEEDSKLCPGKSEFI